MYKYFFLNQTRLYYFFHEFIPYIKCIFTSLIINDLKVFFKPLILTLLLTTSFTSIFAQNFELSIHESDSSNHTEAQTIKYVKKHKTKGSVYKEIDIITKKLMLLGFINSNYSLIKKDSTFYCYYTLNEKINSIQIYYSNKLINESFLSQLTNNYTNTYFEIPTNKVESTLNSIVNYFEAKGASFTTASLRNLRQEEDKLIAELDLKISKKRKINTIIVKGYPNFPKKYLTHYLNLKPNTFFSLKTLNKINELINTIPFVTQLKKPEILFTKDSTTLFLYLKKKATNKFDGIVGFSNKKNSNKIKFNGYLDLNLNNTFNKGESINLKWNKNGGNTQTLNLEFNTPYIFNTRFGTSGNFFIFKQDSTYVNTKSQFKINYSINRNNYINATLSNENSNVTSTLNTTHGIDKFKNTFIGLSYNYKIYTNSQQNYNPKLFINAGYLIGNRTVDNIRDSQNKIQLSAQYLINLNTEHSILIKSTNELLNESNALQNELFRIGGSTIMRGFDEQSIATSKYSANTIEYHYNVSQETQLYTITDVAFILDDFKNTTKQLYGIGLGYFFNTKSRIINLSYVIGKANQSAFNLNNSKFHIKITQLF